MHYKKLQNAEESPFHRLRAQLRGAQGMHLPHAARHNAVPFTQLEQLAGGEIERLSRQIGARFGTRPWKERIFAEDGPDLSAEALAQQWWRSLESFLKQYINSEIKAASPWRQSSGNASRGQVASDYTALLSRYGRRYL